MNPSAVLIGQGYEDMSPVGMQNIIYLRDPSILEDNQNLISMRNLFQHENILDLKEFIQKQIEYNKTTAKDEDRPKKQRKGSKVAI